jgi:hypothetical protein
MPSLRHIVKKIPGMQYFIDLNVVIEDWWFDFYHNVDTSPQLQEQENRGWRKDKVNFHYLPIRPKCARRVLRNLPLKDRGDYTFIDFGSGKGRMLLIASAYGFRRLCGIELRKELHDQAWKNFRQFQNGDGCRAESANVDAASYEFPKQKLVAFFYNPFGREVMGKVLGNLAASLDRYPRDVWVVLNEPSCAYLADNIPQLKLELARSCYRIYRSALSISEPNRSKS